jgi:hypothetical protein
MGLIDEKKTRKFEVGQMTIYGAAVNLERIALKFKGSAIFWGILLK